MEISSMYPMCYGIMLLEESQREQATERLWRWRLRRRETAGIPIGAGTGLPAG